MEFTRRTAMAAGALLVTPDIANAKRKSKGGFDLWKSSDWMISILFPRAIQMAPLALS
jgi:hypothetical protein